MKTLLICAMALILAGCQHIPTVPTEVLVPIAAPCKVEIPAEPAFTFETLTPEDTIWTKVQALLSDRQLSIAYQTELKVALLACK